MNLVLSCIPLLLLPICFGANILGITSFPLLSHQTPFQPLWRELSLRGHKVTVLTSHPVRDLALINLTEIDLSFSTQVAHKLRIFENFINGVNLFESAQLINKFMKDVISVQLESEELQTLVTPNQKFDIVLLDVNMPVYLGFVWKFNCSWIGISSLDAPMFYNGIMGNPIHPIYDFDRNLIVENPYEMSFWERIYCVIYSYAMNTFIKNFLDTFTFIGRKYFEKDMPHLLEMLNNISMLFITTHSMTHDIRPLQPNTVQIGTGIHIKEGKMLPEDIQKFLDNAKEGAIYCAFGSNVKYGMVLKTLYETLIEGFEELPYKVLLQIDGDLNHVPKNVKTGQWMPQQDILRHPNVILFVTHCGLQSLHETIYNGVPIIAIPLFGDGFQNANKATKMGYGLKLEAKTLTKKIFKEAIQEVIKNPRYRRAIEEAMKIFRDEDITGLQKAVYWTEYVIRHKGARHLKNPLANEPFWKYYMLDVFGIAAFIALIMLFLSFTLLRLCFRFVQSRIKKTHVD